MTLRNNNNNHDDTIEDVNHERPTRDQLMPITLDEQQQIMIDATDNRDNDNDPSKCTWQLLELALSISRELDIVLNDVLPQDHIENGADKNEHGAESNQNVQGRDDSVPGRGQ